VAASSNRASGAVINLLNMAFNAGERDINGFKS
jgi:hypothetical protein